MSEEQNKEQQSRRDFISSLTLGTIGVIGSAGVLASCSGTGAVRRDEGRLLTLREQAPDGPVLKAGLVGCGGRGTGAALNFLDAGPNLEIVALGDVFQDQMDKCRKSLKEARDVEVADENCFLGFDSYQKVIDSGVDIVLFATPPHFRPVHVKAAIDADKHVFQEKPVAVDPVGARMMMETTQKAKQKKLCMVSGTALRYNIVYQETRERVKNGMIGEIVSGHAVRNGGALWWIERKPEWTDMEYMLRNWGNFTWLSGDHIVEQHIHHLDLMNWYIDEDPVVAYGYGGREQRISGDQFDQFSIVYEYENGKKVYGSTRQISGTEGRRTEQIIGTEGYANCNGSIYSHDGKLLWEYPYPEGMDKSPYSYPFFVHEHVELITAIRTGNYWNDSELQVKSTRTSIMGRMAAYTGQEITWEEVLNSDLRLGPETYEFGPVAGIPETPPVIGVPRSPSDRYS